MVATITSLSAEANVVLNALELLGILYLGLAVFKLREQVARLDERAKVIQEFQERNGHGSQGRK